MFLVSQMSWLVKNFYAGIFSDTMNAINVKNFNIGIFSDTINVINVKHSKMLLPSKLYLFITLSMTLTLFQGHSSVKQFIIENLMFLPG